VPDPTEAAIRVIRFGDFGDFGHLGDPDDRVTRRSGDPVIR
jgi:hypothetical protein